MGYTKRQIRSTLFTIFVSLGTITRINVKKKPHNCGFSFFKQHDHWSLGAKNLHSLVALKNEFNKKETRLKTWACTYQGYSFSIKKNPRKVKKKSCERVHR
jgi:hypothetical protein